MSKKKLGFALTGSFCTFSKALKLMEELSGIYDIVPIMSETAAATDTRFGTAEHFTEEIIRITGREPISSIAGAEPIGPKKMTDVMLVAPCTGNTLAKLANGVNDTAVTMAVKSHLRNGKPVVIAVSTNDALGASAENIGKLMVRRNIYIVPMRQDDTINKPMSVVADLTEAEKAIEMALKGEQMQPVLK